MGYQEIKQDGKTYRRNWQGTWVPDRDMFGNERVEKDAFGDPWIDRDVFGNQRIERDWMGTPYVTPEADRKPSKESPVSSHRDSSDYSDCSGYPDYYSGYSGYSGGYSAPPRTERSVPLMVFSAVAAALGLAMLAMVFSLGDTGHFATDPRMTFSLSNVGHFYPSSGAWWYAVVGGFAGAVTLAGYLGFRHEVRLRPQRTDERVAAGSKAFSKGEAHRLAGRHVKAAEAFRRGAVLDDADAALALGDCLRTGKGVPRSPRRARHWYLRAWGLGRPAARERLQGGWNRIGRARLLLPFRADVAGGEPWPPLNRILNGFVGALVAAASCIGVLFVTWLVATPLMLLSWSTKGSPLASQDALWNAIVRGNLLVTSGILLVGFLIGASKGHREGGDEAELDPGNRWPASVGWLVGMPWAMAAAVWWLSGSGPSVRGPAALGTLMLGTAVVLVLPPVRRIWEGPTAAAGSRKGTPG